MKAILRVAVAGLLVWFLMDSSRAQAGQHGFKMGDMPPPLLLSDVVQGPAVAEISWEKLKGKVVVLEFWGTRCGPCIQAIPHLN